MIEIRAIVHSAIGGFGNHLRWLLILDSEFVLFDQGPVFNKVEYILEKVYPTNRNPYNWFKFEFKYRQVLNSQIRFAHSNMSPGWENRLGQFDSDFNIFTYPADPNQTFHYHRTLIPTFNKEFYMQEVGTERIQVEKYLKNYTGLLIDSEKFFCPVLDRYLYNSVCNFCKFENYYEHANLIHNAWWIARNRTPNVPQAGPEPLLWPYLLTEVC
jgi:hypothetical protein